MGHVCCTSPWRLECNPPHGSSGLLPCPVALSDTLMTTLDSKDCGRGREGRRAVGGSATTALRRSTRVNALPAHMLYIISMPCTPLTVAAQYCRWFQCNPSYAMLVGHTYSPVLLILSPCHAFPAVSQAAGAAQRHGKPWHRQQQRP